MLTGQEKDSTEVRQATRPSVQAGQVICFAKLKTFIFQKIFCSCAKQTDNKSRHILDFHGV